MIYLIGGSIRCGKSQLSQKVGSNKSIPVISCDDLRDDYVKRLSPSERSQFFPIYTLENGNTERFHQYSIKQNIDLEYYESNHLQSKIKLRVKDIISDNESVVLEGVQLTPQFIRELSEEHANVSFKAIFLIKQNKQKIIEGLKKYISNSSDCWLRDIPEHYLPYYAEFISGISSMIEKECLDFKYPVYNTEDNFTEVINSLSITL